MSRGNEQVQDVWPEADAWGGALLEYLDGGEVEMPELEVDTGKIGPAMHPEWFFRPYDEWDWWDRELLSAIEAGPVLDLGCGAGRASLYLQARGFEVTAVDASPGAVEVCRRRGVSDVRLGDLNDPPADKRWASILLLCGNLGLGGSWDGNRRLLARLAELSSDDAVLIGDSVTPSGEPEIGLRIRYRGQATPWWRQYNIPADRVGGLVAGTGWVVDRQIVDGTDHSAVLRRQT